jgi:hypothetical protein
MPAKGNSMWLRGRGDGGGTLVDVVVLGVGGQ